MSDQVIERLIRKIDFHLLPLLTILYFFSYMDRMNIANARLFNFTEDLNMTESQYSWSNSIFFLSYAIFEIPSNFLMGKFSPSVWIGSLILSCGIIVVFMIFVQNAVGLLITRFIMGVAAAGFFPGIIFHISLWYSRRDQALRIGLFFCGAILSGAFGGILAYLIGQLGAFGHLKGWQWIFLLEGLPTVGFSLLTYKFLADFPRDVTWLNVVEKELLADRLRKDVQFLEDSQDNNLWQQIHSVLSDWKVWMYTVINFCTVTPLFSLSSFLPTMINDMGFDKPTSQLLTVPPHIVSCIACLIVSWNAGRLNERGFHILLCSLIGIAGFLYLLLAKESLYIGAFIACIGVFSTYPLIPSWFTYNIVGIAKRSLAVSLILGCGSLGGVLSGQIYAKTCEPRHCIGHGMMVGCLGLNIVLVLLMKHFLKRENMRRTNYLINENSNNINQIGDSIYVT